MGEAFEERTLGKQSPHKKLGRLGGPLLIPAPRVETGVLEQNG